MEKEYRNLADKLQNFENLFSESSMEGVIYQLAKVLFYQSFSMSKLLKNGLYNNRKYNEIIIAFSFRSDGFEAQESLKQFTTFLETQVDEGHISRNMERKVLGECEWSAKKATVLVRISIFRRSPISIHNNP